MQIKMADNENADGSINVSIEDLSDQEINAIINAGFVKMLTDSLKYELANIRDKKYMSTIVSIAVHPIDQGPYDEDAIHLSLYKNSNKYSVEIVQNDIMEYDAEKNTVIAEVARRLMDQTSVERNLGLKT